MGRGNWVISQTDTLMAPAIALIDGNNFYVSCERVFRPDLEQKPVIVMSNNDGCIISRSDQVKVLGIKMGTPIFKIREQVQQHGIHLFSANFPLYGDISARVVAILRCFSPEIEVYSIDETFLNLGTLPEAKATHEAHNMRAQVHQSLGIPTCVGIGPTKTLAKLANTVAKKNALFKGVCNLNHAPLRHQVFKCFPVGEIWGIGAATAKTLNARGVITAADLLQYPLKQARCLHSVLLERLILELRGIACADLELQLPKKKGIAVTRSFGQPVHDFSGIMESITHHTTRAAEKLRQQQRVAGLITVFMHTSAHRGGPQYHAVRHTDLSPMTANNFALLKAAKACALNGFRKGYAYLKSGVMLGDLHDQYQISGLLFDDTPYDNRLMQTLDQINQTFGTATVFHASQVIKQRWTMKQAQRSPRYTTCLKDVPTVLA